MYNKVFNNNNEVSKIKWIGTELRSFQDDDYSIDFSSNSITVYLYRDVDFHNDYTVPRIKKVADKHNLFFYVH